MLIPKRPDDREMMRRELVAKKMCFVVLRRVEIVQVQVELSAASFAHKIVSCLRASAPNATTINRLSQSLRKSNLPFHVLIERLLKGSLVIGVQKKVMSSHVATSTKKCV